VNDNPEGVISLPTGKTPEHFIKWTKHLLDNWSEPKLDQLRKENGLELNKKLDLRELSVDQF